MLLKRKRSDVELSYGSVFASTQQVGESSFNFDAIAAMETARRGFFSPRLSTPSHLHSRTMKRVRNNRPAESEVYQHTLDVLYSAQQRGRDCEPRQPPSPPKVTNGATIVRNHTDTRPVTHQRSLHSFWNLPDPSTSTNPLVPSPASSAASFSSPSIAPHTVSTHCDDCGVGLVGSEDDAMMDVDGYSLNPDDHLCEACGKTVCFSCSVSNLGEHRRCLACAGSNIRPAVYTQRLLAA
ncbi:hypothetical protein VTK26DRAFT_2034 [Humicola hyalothermophila]